MISLPHASIIKERTIDRNKLSDYVYSEIKRGIYEFRLPPGQRYSEASLSEMLSVSRTPLRLALYILEHEGYLQKLSGHNCWQVKPLDLSYYEDIYDFRTEIEVLALRLMRDAHSSPQIVALSEFWCIGNADRVQNCDLVAEQDENFHLTIVRLANNQAMLRTFAEITDKIRVIRRLDFASMQRISTTYDEHASILNSITSRDRDGTEFLLRRHIENSREEIRKITVQSATSSRSNFKDI